MSYATYDSYKDSGVDWLGEIPSDWDLQPAFKYIKENKTKNTGLLENTVLSLSYGKIIIKPEEKLTGLVPESFETYQIVEPNDIIIRCTDLQNDKVSLRTGLVENRGIITSAYLGLKVFQNYNSKFLHYYLHSLDITKAIYKFGTGLRQNLSFLDFKRLPLVDISLDLQQKIANFLDQKTAQIDQAIALKQQQIEKLNEYKQIVIQNAVTKGLNPNAPMKNSGVDWIGDIPEHWEITATKRLLEIPITDGPHTTPLFYDEGIPFISAESIKNGKINFDKKRGYISKADYDLYSKKYKPKRNDIYMVKSGATTGRVAMVETDEIFTIWSPLAVFRTKNNVLLPKFLFYYLQSSSFQKSIELAWSYGTQQNIGMGVLGNLQCVIPPLAEQEKIIDFIEPYFSKFDKTKQLYQTQIDRLKEYKNILINQAVTGKIKI